MNIEFMCGLLANYSKELSEAETYRKKGDVQVKHAKLILDKVKNCSIPAVMESDCDHEWLNHSYDHFGFLQEQICDKCGAKQSVP